MFLAMKESPIFIKSFETLEWILNHTSKFPKPQRFVMAKRIEEAALAFHDNLLLAAKRQEKRAALGEADFHLERLKVYNRLAMRLKLSSFAPPTERPRVSPLRGRARQPQRQCRFSLCPIAPR